ncbi:MAG: endopeptidase La [Oscillospiraceae bacterium]
MDNINMQDNAFLNMPMVALRGLVVFPNATIHFDVGRKISIAAVKAAMNLKQDIFLTAQIDVAKENADITSVYKMGTVCEIKQIVKVPVTNYLRVVIEGKYRARLIDIVEDKPYLISTIKPVLTTEPKPVESLQVGGLMRHAQTLFEDYVMLSERVSPDVAAGILAQKLPGEMADFITSNIPLDYVVKQKILTELNPLKRLERLCIELAREIDLLEVEGEISDRVQGQIDENQREYYLREQLKAISIELNDGDSIISDSQKYREAILKLNLQKEYEKKLLAECNRLTKMQETSPESMVIRNYLDVVLSLPWNTYTKDSISISNAKKILDKDHYGLNDVKERIVELLAVRMLSPDIKGQIICLVGPPGVGKTSIARSLAKAMNRKYARLSLGGVRDEAEIRGHRKTYIGAMPGSIIDCLIHTKSSNPLILLDEIDKLSSDYKGDPSSALLEALDPEQNNTFKDHYIEIPFDLSKVLFVTTANDASQIPAPLLDRMDIIELYSYTYEEKFNIAKKHLISKQLKENGLKSSQIKITDAALRVIIEGYTREAGVRKLERCIAKLCRKVAVKIAEGHSEKITIKETDLKDLLGAIKYKGETLSLNDEVGVVNGLAWTSVGGEMLKVEAISMEGTGKLELTGSLGDVMKESAKAAYSYIRSKSSELSINADFYKTKDVHLHFPEGAVPKDGPSAGIAITTALVSTLSGNPVRSNIAMTGEVTLTGRVLPIGGLKEKSMAAYKAGVKTVIIPDDNLSDLDEIDKVVKDKINFIPVSNVNEVLKIAIFKKQENCAAKNIALPKMENTNIDLWHTN